jgi:hypothetical protein
LKPLVSVDVGGLDDVVVVEHEDDPAGESVKVVQQAGQHGLDRGQARFQARHPAGARARAALRMAATR